jgi:hypothetical protein
MHSSRATPRRRHARIAGSLRGDLAELACRLHEAVHHDDITVWTDEQAQVYFDTVGATPELAPHWLAGTYGVGARADDIEADLQVLRHERLSTAMIVDEEQPWVPVH